MEIGGLKIVFKEVFLVKDMLEFQRINEKYEKEKIDGVDLQNEMLKLAIISVNGETNSEKKIDLLLNMESFDDFAKIVEKVTKKISDFNSVKKKKS